MQIGKIDLFFQNTGFPSNLSWIGRIYGVADGMSVASGPMMPLDTSGTPPGHHQDTTSTPPAGGAGSQSLLYFYTYVHTRAYRHSQGLASNFMTSQSSSCSVRTERCMRRHVCRDVCRYVCGVQICQVCLGRRGLGEHFGRQESKDLRQSIYLQHRCIENQVIGWGWGWGLDGWG